MPEIADWYRRKPEIQSLRDWPSFGSPPNFTAAFPDLFRNGIADPAFVMFPTPDGSFEQELDCHGNIAQADLVPLSPLPPSLFPPPYETALLILGRAPAADVLAGLAEKTSHLRLTVVLIGRTSLHSQAALHRFTPDVFALEHFLDLRAASNFVAWLMATRAVRHVATDAVDALAISVLPEAVERVAAAGLSMSVTALVLAEQGQVPSDGCVSIHPAGWLEALPPGAQALSILSDAVLRCGSLAAGLSLWLAASAKGSTFTQGTSKKPHTASVFTHKVGADLRPSDPSVLPFDDNTTHCQLRALTICALTTEARIVHATSVEAELGRARRFDNIDINVWRTLASPNSRLLAREDEAGWPTHGLPRIWLDRAEAHRGQLRVRLRWLRDDHRSCDLDGRRVYLQLTHEGRGVIERRWEADDPEKPLW